MKNPSIDAVKNEAQLESSVAEVKYMSLTDEDTDCENNNDVHENNSLEIRSAPAGKRKVNGKRVKRTKCQFSIKCGVGNCAEFFESIDAVMLHRSSYHEHGVTRCFSCYLCKKPLRSKQANRHHMNSVHTGRRFKCPFPLCPRSFGQKPYVKYHVNAVHLKRVRLSCTKCPKKFYKNHNLKTHLAAKRGDGIALSCDLCQKPLSTRRSLQRHMNTQHPDCSNVQFVPKTLPN